MVRSPVVVSSIEKILAEKERVATLPFGLESNESKIYDCEDVSNDDFVEHQEHQVEDLSGRGWMMGNRYVNCVSYGWWVGRLWKKL